MNRVSPAAVFALFGVMLLAGTVVFMRSQPDPGSGPDVPAAVSPEPADRPPRRVPPFLKVPQDEEIYRQIPARYPIKLPSGKILMWETGMEDLLPPKQSPFGTIEEQIRKQRKPKYPEASRD